MRGINKVKVKDFMEKRNELKEQIEVLRGACGFLEQGHQTRLMDKIIVDFEAELARMDEKIDQTYIVDDSQSSFRSRGDNLIGYMPDES